MSKPDFRSSELKWSMSMQNYTAQKKAHNFVLGIQPQSRTQKNYNYLLDTKTNLLPLLSKQLPLPHNC